LWSSANTDQKSSSKARLPGQGIATSGLQLFAYLVLVLIFEWLTVICMRLTPFWIIGFLLNAFVFPNNKLYSQCSPQIGPGPAGTFFNTGQESPGANDTKWKVALDSITGEFKSAIVMSGLPPLYHNSAHWISFSTSGEHLSNRFFFFKINVDLPCFNLCGKSYDEDNAYCLNLDLYADNSIYEIYINGIPQSGNLGNIIPLANHSNPPGHTQSDKTTVSLCKEWKAGPNTLIIQIASSATVAGLLVEPSVTSLPPPDADTIPKTICEGETVSFGNLLLTKSGYYFQSFPRPGGCDSNVVMHLVVNTKPTTEISASICEGDNFEGYTTSGIFVNNYMTANGCDSIRKLHLQVRGKPQPVLPATAGICPGDSLVLSPGEFDSYSWQDGSINEHFVVRIPGIYSVSVTNSCGTAFSEIKVKDGVCKTYFPSAFTPNFDRKNDFFKILTDLKFRDFHLVVFNRWGQQIFASEDPGKGWDGTFNGKEQPPGTYVWKCVFTRSNISTQLKGTVILVR
jgi:gliding motility-associated-like protein